MVLALAVAACGSDSRGSRTVFVDSLGIAARDPALWPTMTFVPRGTEIDGVPVSKIDTTWSLATALSEDLLPPHDSLSPFALADSVGFQFDGDFNQDDVLDRARVGVYRDTTGTEGSFLIILTRSDSAWVPAFVATEPGEPRFSVLVNDRSGLVWAECLTCGRWRPVFWADGHYELGPPADPSSQ
jgi:hypothetical protein